MEHLPANQTGPSPLEPRFGSVLKTCGLFVTLTFCISWGVWLVGYGLGVRPGVHEEWAYFGSSGPALAAIFMVRRRSGTPLLSLVGLRKRLVRFILLWAAGWIVYLVTDKWRGMTLTWSTQFCLTVAVLALIPAWIASGALSENPGVTNLLHTLTRPRDWRWLLAAFLLIPAILLLPTLLVSPIHLRIVWPHVQRGLFWFAGFGVLMFLRALFFTAIFEEPGWRGFLLPLVQQRFSPLTASLLVALPWALWHLPLDLGGWVGHNLLLYLTIRVFFHVPYTIILTWLYNRSRGNLLTIAILHASVNTFPQFLPYPPWALGLIIAWAGYAVVAEKMWRGPVSYQPRQVLAEAE